MNRLFWHLNHLAFLFYLVFSSLAFYFFFFKDNSQFGFRALLCASIFMVFQIIFKYQLKTLLLKEQQPKYKIVFLFESKKKEEILSSQLEDIPEIQLFLSESNVDSCVFMDYELYQKINPTFTTDKFPHYLIINGQDLIDDRVLLKTPLYHHTSATKIIDFLKKQNTK